MLWFLAHYWKSNNSVHFRAFRIILFLLNPKYWGGCIPIHQAYIRLNQIYWSHFACNQLYSFLLTSIRKSCTTENCGGVVAIAVCPDCCFLHNKDPCVGKPIYAGGSSLSIWVVSIRNRIYSQVQLYLKYLQLWGCFHLRYYAMLYPYGTYVTIFCTDIVLIVIAQAYLQDNEASYRYHSYTQIGQ